MLYRCRKLLLLAGTISTCISVIVGFATMNHALFGRLLAEAVRIILILIKTPDKYEIGPEFDSSLENRWFRE